MGLVHRQLILFSNTPDQYNAFFTKLNHYETYELKIHKDWNEYETFASCQCLFFDVPFLVKNYELINEMSVNLPFALLVKGPYEFEKANILVDKVDIIIDVSGEILCAYSAIKTCIKYHTLSSRRYLEFTQNDVKSDLIALVMDVLPDLFWLKDEFGRYITCNHRFEEFFGASKKEIIGKTDYDFVDKKIADEFRKDDLNAVKMGRPITIEESVVFSTDQHIEMLETIKTPIYKPDGSLYGVLGVARDVSKRIEMEKQLLEMNNHLELAVEESTKAIRSMTERLSLAVSAGRIGIWDWNLVTDQAWWDNTMYALYNCSPTTDEATEDIWRRIIHPDDLDDLDRELKEKIATEKEFDFRFRIVNGDGEIRYIRDRAMVVRNERGTPVRVIGVSIDETDKVLREIHLEEEKEAAESATVAKSNFLANMSHEIRTPINAVVGTVYLMKKTTLTDIQLDYVNKIDLSTNQLLGIINDILDFSKVEAGKMTLEHVEFPLELVTANVYELMSIKANEKDLEFQVFIDEEVPKHLFGDAFRLGQILINLTSNAIKFTSKGCVTVWVDYITNNEEAGWVRFHVKDTGIGLSSEQIDRLLEPFSQADNSITRNYGGTGLGLSISQQLLKLMGSEICIESEIGKGSHFYFDIEMVQQSEIEQSSIIRDEEVTNDGPIKDGLRVLLVEDNELNQFITVEILKSHGAYIDIAENGQIAVDILRRCVYDFYDIVLMDLQMPVMDGFEATKRIREIHGANIPIIALTAEVMNIANRIQEGNMDDYITKPIDIKQLLHVINKWT